MNQIAMKRIEDDPWYNICWNGYCDRRTEFTIPDGKYPFRACDLHAPNGWVPDGPQLPRATLRFYGR